MSDWQFCNTETNVRANQGNFWLLNAALVSQITAATMMDTEHSQIKRDNDNFVMSWCNMGESYFLHVTLHLWQWIANKSSDIASWIEVYVY